MAKAMKKAGAMKAMSHVAHADKTFTGVSMRKYYLPVVVAGNYGWRSVRLKHAAGYGQQGGLRGQHVILDMDYMWFYPLGFSQCRWREVSFLQ